MNTKAILVVGREMEVAFQASSVSSASPSCQGSCVGKKKSFFEQLPLIKTEKNTDFTRRHFFRKHLI